MEYVGYEKDGLDRRFVLEGKSSVGRERLYVFGINPSDAQGKVVDNLDWVHEYVQEIHKPQVEKGPDNDYALDKTITRVEKFSTQDKDYKFSDFVMLNICAQRTTNQEVLKCNDNLHRENIECIKKIMKDKEQKNRSINVLLAFGDPKKKGDQSWLYRYFTEIIEMLKKEGFSMTFYVLKDEKLVRNKKSVLTKEGNPRHPSRLSDETHLMKIDFNKNNPLAEFSKWDFLK